MLEGGGYRLIVENPYHQEHYLKTYFPVKPKLVIKDRTVEGDYYKKPTQFWFVNCDPEQNVIFEPLDFVKTHTIERIGKTDDGQSVQVRRSLIHPQFAERFIRSYVLDAQ